MKEQAIQLDKKDPLKDVRTKFHFPKDEEGNPKVYLCGNSLGLQPKRAADYVQAELTKWSKYGVDGHFEGEIGWVDYHKTLTAGISRLVGAKESEVVAMGTLTSNLHHLFGTFYRPKGKRRKILMEAHAFPSDIYLVKSQIDYQGGSIESDLILIEPDKDFLVKEEQILDAIHQHADELALVFLGGVNYLSGQVFDLEKIGQATRAAGAYFGVDLAHAIGNVPLQLHDQEVDFAAWCTYKYLNSGPGAVAGLFVHEKNHHLNTKSLHGWWGVELAKRFEMKPHYEGAPGAESWQLSNGTILGMAPQRASLEILEGIELKELWKKQKRQISFLRELLEEFEDSVQILTPKDPEQSAGQLSLRIKGGKAVFQRLTELNVIGDWREPDVIRVATAPLYNSFEDLANFAIRLGKSLKEPV